jgi:hypothetical protein
MRLEAFAVFGFALALLAGCASTSGPTRALTAAAPAPAVAPAPDEEDDDEMTESEIALAQEARLRSAASPGRVTAQSVERVGPYRAPLLLLSAVIGVAVDASTLTSALSRVEKNGK